MKTTIIHKGKERTWEGPYENWQRHKEYIMGWCDGREIEGEVSEGNWSGRTIAGTPLFHLENYRFKPAKAEPVVFEGRLISKETGTCMDSTRIVLGASKDAYDKIGLGKRYKITIEEV